MSYVGTWMCTPLMSKLGSIDVYAERQMHIEEEFSDLVPWSFEALPSLNFTDTYARRAAESGT